MRIDDVNAERTGIKISAINGDTLKPLNDPEGFLRSGLTNISVSEEEAAYNYPNPFNPNKQTTRIVYNSNSAGSATIKIFTITGKLVRKLSDNAQSGSNEAVWDGKNGRGQVVRNGVYVAIIMPPSGSNQTVKIAVVK